MNRPRILGHRGAPRVAVENTVPAFRAAIAAGAEGVELDVRLCATGELVVCHDATLARLAGVPVRVRQSSAWALRQWDLGGGATVPTLADVIAAIGRAALNVEIKTDDGDPIRLARAVAREVSARWRRGQWLYVSSFDPRALIALRHFAPDIPRGLLLSDVLTERAATLAASAGVLASAVHPHASLCTESTVARWKGAGLRVHVWTVDDVAEFDRLAALGVDAVITNEPARLVAHAAASQPSAR